MLKIINNKQLVNSLVELIKITSTQIPDDVVLALLQANKLETVNSSANLVLSTILKNIALAQNKSLPICQDTGFLNFFVKLPLGISANIISQNIILAVKKATNLGYLRPNSVNICNNRNTGDNIGINFPAIYFSESSNNDLEISLLLKGGGSENVSDQIALPTITDFGPANRDLDGVKKAVLQVIKNAQGKGCAPGIISVHIGSDRAGGFYYAKQNLLTPLGNSNLEPDIAKIEQEIIKTANNLDIGPMGLGGKSTILDCKISLSDRLPACFFVTVSYMCWALRRNKILITDQKIIPPVLSKIDLSLFLSQFTNNKIKTLNFPATAESIKNLQSGDMVLINGIIFTGRDQIHQMVSQGENLTKNLQGSAIYHCGPIAMEDKNHQWSFLSAGPTTSAREEPYQADFIKKTGIKAIIGKGGMGAKTAEAMKKHQVVYLHAIGGAAVYYAQNVKAVKSVSYLEEFGMPEALWEIEVKDFLCIVD